MKSRWLIAAAGVRDHLLALAPGGSVQVRAVFNGVEAWTQLVSLTPWVTLRWVWIVGFSFILCHMCAFGKWMFIQNLMWLLIKSIKYQIKNILSLQRLNFESRSPPERLKSIKQAFIWPLFMTSLYKECGLWTGFCDRCEYVHNLNCTELGFWNVTWHSFQ